MRKPVLCALLAQMSWVIITTHDSCMSQVLSQIEKIYQQTFTLIPVVLLPLH